jgi:purine-binding chemotaxis protein CheW
MEERFLLFSVAGEPFAFNLLEISEVMEPPASFPVPLAPRHFIGLINFHGALTALVDLALYLGHGRRSATGKVLVIDTKLASLALKVDGVNAIITAEAVQGMTPGEDPLTAALLETEQGTFRLVRLEALLFALEQGLLPPDVQRA